MKRKILILAVALITSLACSTTSNVTNNAPSNNTVINSINNSTNNPVELSEEDTSQSSQPGPDTLDLSDPFLYSVAEQSNAEIEMIMSYSGQNESGATVEGQLHLTGVVSKDLPGIYIDLKMGGDAAFDGVEHVVMADLPDSDYFYTADTGCIAFANNEFNNPFNDFMQNSEFVGFVDLVERDIDVKGYLSDKYLLTAENMPPEEDATDEFVEIYESYLYVAQDGGFIIRIELNWLGTNEALSGSGTSLGNNAAIYGFIPIFTAVEISPPSECNVSEDTGVVETQYPMLADATEVSALGDDLLQYKTSMSVEEIVAFYEAEMVALGYDLGESLNYGEAAFVNFTLDGKQITLIVNKVDGSNDYTITIGG